MQEKRINKLEEEVKDLKNNHILQIKLNIAKIKTDIKWLLKFFWIVAVATIGGLIASVIALL